MAAFSKTLLVFLLISATAAESPDPPLSETRLTISTLVREDIFAGLLENDMQRLARGSRPVCPAYRPFSGSRPFIEKIQTLLPDTPYANIAQQWKESPESAASTSITCRTCHESGRLAARLAALK